MSKQKRGMFRRIVNAGRKIAGLPVTHQYDDPVIGIGAPEERRKKSPGRYKYRPVKELGPKVLPCEPGTIEYHDKLVRHFGRRRAEGYRHCIQRGMHSALPTAQDFDDNVPWGFLKKVHL